MTYWSLTPARTCLAAALTAGLAALIAQQSLPAAAVPTSAPAPATTTKIKVETVAKGLEHPWGLQFLPDGRMLVTEKPGRLRIVAKDGTLSEPIPGVPGVDARDQGGLLDVRISPDFARSGFVYLSFSEVRQGGKTSTSVARGKLVLDDKAGRIEGLSIIFRQEPAVASNMHFGSRLVFDRVGALFITTGERNSAKYEAQNPANHIGKVIRINADGSIPNDNPQIKGWAPEIWSIGHRNVQGAALHPETGALWTAAHGAKGGDEVNLVQAGKNYGWPVISYGIDYSGAKIGEGQTKEGMEAPVYYWDPSIAVSGLEFYTGNLFPDWKGNLLVGALKGQKLVRLVFEGDQVVREESLLTDLGARIRDVRQGLDGAVYILTDEADGKILRLTP